jgi:hypothetical protein
VSFTNRRYSHALAMGEAQDKLFDEILHLPDVEANWDNGAVLGKVKKWLVDHPEYDHA